MTLDSTHYRCAVRDQLLEVTPDSPLSTTKVFGCNQDSPINPFFDYGTCITEGSSSPSPTISSTWSSSSAEPSPMLSSSLSNLVNTLNVSEQHTLLATTELRTDENVTPEAFCSEIRYNNNVARDFDSSVYSEPVDGVSQLESATAIPGFGDYGSGIAVQDNHWIDRYFQVFSLGNEGPGAVHTPFEHAGTNSIARAFPAQRTLNLNLGGCKSSPSAMRKHWIQVARSSHSVNESDVRKVFSKNPKTKVATPNTLRASALRRKHPAKFKCSVNGCSDDFTRKHNLENHLRSHCGVTDLICPLCDKGFTTIPVWKRHQKSCSRTASRADVEDPKSFLAMITTEGHESKVLIS